MSLEISVILYFKYALTYILKISEWELFHFIHENGCWSPWFWILCASSPLPWYIYQPIFKNQLDEGEM